MRPSLILSTVLAAAVAASGCGGGSTTPTPPTPSVVTVSVVGTQGNGSFVPNPVATASGNQVMFKNNDPVGSHHIVMDDGSADFGNLSPGVSGPVRAVLAVIFTA